MKINYNFSEQQYLELEESRKKAGEISRILERMSWLFDVNSPAEEEFLKMSHLAERIEIFCEEQLPF